MKAWTVIVEWTLALLVVYICVSMNQPYILRFVSVKLLHCEFLIRAFIFLLYAARR